MNIKMMEEEQTDLVFSSYQERFFSVYTYTPGKLQLSIFLKVLLPPEHFYLEIFGNRCGYELWGDFSSADVAVYRTATLF